MRLGGDAKVDLLKRVPLFSGCSKDELRRLAGVADEIDVPEGSTLTRQGKSGREFGVIIEGTAEVVRDGEKIGELSGGDWFGEIALITNSPRTATVTATSNVRMLVVTDRAFWQVLEKAPTIAVNMLERLGERLARDQDQLGF